VLRGEFADFSNFADAVRLVVRLLVALALGAMLGYEREHVGKPAGLRTHMLVSLSTALLTLTPILAGMDASSVSRVIQGLAAGIGFVGGGAILKLTDRQQIRGLTTAASIWLAAAVGVAAGLGRHAAALLGAVLGLLILFVMGTVEHRFQGRSKGEPPAQGASRK
jgi:putative Mg2+ transporter-C (MgtC) family protein